MNLEAGRIPASRRGKKLKGDQTVAQYVMMSMEN